jgi:superfamily I DNA/RNA helicase
VVRQIQGDWNKSLYKSYRLTGSISNIAIKFQKTYFDKLYELDDIKILSTLDFETRILEYHFLKTHTVKNLYLLIYSIIEKHKIHSSDIGILCSTVEIIRELDFFIRTIKNEKTKTTFESQEEYELIVNSLKSGLIDSTLSETEINKKIQKELQDILDHIRRVKKIHFWMKTGTVKLSTIHSFKGWEIDTLFLFIENEEGKEDEFTDAELIYTGITRARKNLIVFNLGNLKYHEFFKTEIGNQFIE